MPKHAPDPNSTQEQLPEGGRASSNDVTRPESGKPRDPGRPGTRELATMNLLVENLSDGVLLLDEDGIAIDSNASANRLFGEEIPLGIHVTELAARYDIRTIDDAPLPPNRLPSMRALTGESVRGAELSLTRTGGGIAHVSASASPVVVRGGRRGALVVLSDITERVRRDREAVAFRTLSQQLAASEQDVEAVYRTVVRRIGEITGATTVRLMLFDADSRTLRRMDVAGGRGRRPEVMPLTSQAIEALAARTRLPVVVPDLAQYRQRAGKRARTSGSAIAVPLVVRGELIGSLSYDLPEPHPFDDAEIAFLGMIASQSAMAIHNATMLQQRTRERAFLADIIDHLPAGLVVFEVVRPRGAAARAGQPDYRITMVNELAARYLAPALSRRTGGPRRAKEGVRIRRIARDEQSQRLVWWLDRALELGEIVTSDEVKFDGYGEDDQRESYWTGSIVPIRDGHEPVRELVLLASNVTEQVASRRRVEELVRIAGSRAAEIEATVSAISDPVTVCDASGRIRLANRAALETYGVDSLAALLRMEGLDERVHLRETSGEQVPPGRRPLERALAGETLQADFTVFHHGLGRDVHRRASAAPVLATGGEIIGAVMVETDITGLIEVDRLKDEFFSMAAHELRTPLTAIRGYTQILERRVDSPDPLTTKAIITLRDQEDRMERLINELLDVARIESGQLDFRYSELDLVELLERLVTDISHAHETHVVSLQAEPAAIVGTWDRDRLEQVFSNLLTNAVKYSPDGGSVRVSATWSGRSSDPVSVAVTDDGIGIAPEHVPRLFARYSRVGDPDHFRQSGLGLGLYITKQIVDSHGGSIAIQSQPGQGTTFTVSLPLSPRRRGRPASDQC